MKDKYFGDEHDFRKYGLLQFLQGGCTSGWEWKVCLNWMRTKFEPALFNNDGNRRSYDLLKKNAESIFDKLAKYNKEKTQERTVTEFPSLDIMNLGTGYYDYFVPDITDVNKIRDLGTLRNKWFSRFLTKYENFDLIFFDPDNGIEVKSSKFGTKGSYKYLYLHEIDEIWKRKQNILIYQHRNRQKMNDFLKGKYCLLKKYGMPLTFCAGTGVVFFLLLQQPTLVNTIKRAFNDKKYAPEYLSLLN